MNITDEILGQASGVFDVAGISAENDKAVLIFGLESTDERNLDKMAYKDERWQLIGWTEHLKPKLETMIDVLQKKGFEAETVGFWGYPSDWRVMHLKRMAVMAGLGQQGKNTLMLEPEFGHRLRLAALRTNAPLIPTGLETYERSENPFCESCNACIDACPVEELLEPYRLTDPARCLCNTQNITEQDGLMATHCNEACRITCPVCR